MDWGRSWSLSSARRDSRFFRLAAIPSSVSSIEAGWEAWDPGCMPAALVIGFTAARLWSGRERIISERVRPQRSIAQLRREVSDGADFPIPYERNRGHDMAPPPA